MEILVNAFDKDHPISMGICGLLCFLGMAACLAAVTVPYQWANIEESKGVTARLEAGYEQVLDRVPGDRYTKPEIQWRKVTKDNK